MKFNHFLHVLPTLSLGLAFAAWTPGSLHADVISVNFIGTAGANGTLGSSDLAGITSARAAAQGFTLSENAFVDNWSNADGAAGNLSSLTTSSGLASSVSISWNAQTVWTLPDTTIGPNNAGGANPAMMRGYLDFLGDGIGATTTVAVAGIQLAPATTYDVIVYFDGDNGNDWRVANYRLFDSNGYDQTLFGEDSEGVNFNGAVDASGGNENFGGYFQHPLSTGTGNQVWPVVGNNNNEGNYVLFQGLTGSSFNIEAWGSSNLLRAPVNGIQIIGASTVPEPSSLALVLLGLVGLLRLRPR